MDFNSLKGLSDEAEIRKALGANLADLLKNFVDTKVINNLYFCIHLYTFVNK